MRPDIVAGAVFPDYELYDHTAKRIECSLLAGTFSPHERGGVRLLHPRIEVLSRGARRGHADFRPGVSGGSR